MDKENIIEDITVEEIAASLIEDVDASEKKPSKPEDVTPEGAPVAAADSVAKASSEPAKTPENTPEPVGTVPVAPEVAASLATVDALSAATDAAAAPVVKTETETAPVKAPVAAPAATPEEEKPVAESLTTLMQAEKSLTEDFRTKAAALFEQAVKVKFAAEVLRLEENYRAQLDEEVAKAVTGLSEKVDGFLNLVTQEWLTENTVAIEAGLRTEIAEQFMTGLQSLFKESYIEVPAGKENLVDTLNTKVSALEEQLNKAVDGNVKLNETVNTLTRGNILAEVASDLASTEVVKLNSLVEAVKFEDAASFKSKVAAIKETYFRKTAKSTETETIVLNEEQDQSLTPAMSAYSTAITRTLQS